MKRLDFAIALLAAGLLSQQAFHIPADEITMTARPYSPGLTLHVQVDTLEIPVVVRNRDQVPIAGIPQADFSVFDDGKPVPITGFSIETRPQPTPTAPTPQTSVPPGSSPPAAAASPALPTRQRWIVLYLDDLHTEANDLANASRAAQRFLQTSFGPGDHVAIAGSIPAKSLSFTQDVNQAIAVLRAMSFHSRNAPEGGCPLITPSQAYEITEFFSATDEAFRFADAQFLNCFPKTPAPTREASIREKAIRVWAQTEQQSQDVLDQMAAYTNALAEMEGDRVLILASSGFLTPTLESRIESITNLALRSKVVINALDTNGMAIYMEQHGFDDPTIVTGSKFLQDPIDFRARNATWDALQASAPMAQMAFGTGGRMFENSNDFQRGFTQLAAAPETTYLLAIKPARAKNGGVFHKLRVEVAGQANTDVQFRLGYFAPTDREQSSAPDAAKDALDAAMQPETAVREEIPIIVNFVGGSGAVKLAVALDPRGFPWRQDHGRRSEQLAFVAALYSTDGKFVTGTRGDMILQLKDATWKHISTPGQGLAAGLDLNAPSGSYELRLVVRESIQGLLTSRRWSVTVP